MTIQKKTMVIFTDKANSAFDTLMGKYNLQESLQEEFERYIKKGKFTRWIMLRRVIKALAGKSISEEEFIIAVEKIISIDQQKAVQIAQDIKMDIIPFLEVFPEEKLSDPIFREEIAKKIWGSEKISPESSIQEILLEKIRDNTRIKNNASILISKVKKIDITNVEENAKFSQKDKVYTDEMKKIIQEEPKEANTEKVQKTAVTAPAQQPDNNIGDKQNVKRETVGKIIDRKEILNDQNEKIKEAQKSNQEDPLNKKGTPGTYREPIE